jgi:hypothetical protein
MWIDEGEYSLSLIFVWDVYTSMRSDLDVKMSNLMLISKMDSI